MLYVGTDAGFDQPTRDRAADTMVTPATPALAPGVLLPFPEPNPTPPPRTNAFASDPSLAIPVIASPEDIVRARELRQQLRKRYLDGPSEACSLWSVGID
jgi:hypothetical protein